MVKNTELAVILPHYNYEEFIVETLNCVKNQTYKDFTLYIVDDASTDSSPKLIEDFIESNKDIDIVYTRHDVNKFIGAALNTGHRLVLKNGHTYITWLSSDNLYKENCFSRLVDSIKSQDVDFLYTAFEYIFPNGSVRMSPSEPYTRNSFMDKKWSQGICYIYKKDVYERIGEFMEGISHVQDYDYCVRMELEGLKIGYSPESLGLCRCHNNRRSYLHEKEINQQRLEIYKKYKI